MKNSKLKFLSVLVLSLSMFSSFVFGSDKNKKEASVAEANVWTTADSAKHFKCPVMGSEGVVKESTPYSIVDGKKYYHCCGGCSAKFTGNTAKYLDGFVVPGNVVKVDEKGQHFQCLVSGEIGVVADKTVYSDKDGKRYYFCCADCKKSFDTNANKFLNKQEK